MGTDRMGGPWRAAVLESPVVSRVVGPQSAALLVFGSTLGPSTLSDLASPRHNPPSDCFPVLASLRSDTDLQPRQPAWYILGTGSAFPGLTFVLLTPPASVAPQVPHQCLSGSDVPCHFSAVSLCLFLSLPLSLSLSCFVSGCSCLVLLPSAFSLLSLSISVSLSVCLSVRLYLSAGLSSLDFSSPFLCLSLPFLYPPPISGDPSLNPFSGDTEGLSPRSTPSCSWYHQELYGYLGGDIGSPTTHILVAPRPWLPSTSRGLGA